MCAPVLVQRKGAQPDRGETKARYAHTRGSQRSRKKHEGDDRGSGRKETACETVLPYLTWNAHERQDGGTGTKKTVVR